MPSRLPPAQTLHAFDAAARHMSFTGAARELGITQAAVSQRIRTLEHQLGQALFLREPGGLELTEAGRAFVPAVHEAFARLSTGIAEAFGTPRDAPLTVRTTPAFASRWLAPRLRDFQARHPDVVIRIASAVWPSDFDLDGADVEIRYGRGDWSGVECRRLTRERLTPVCAPSTAESLNTVEDLAGHHLLHAAGFETGWPQWLASVGAEDMLERTTPLIGDTMAVVLSLAARDAGIALGRSGFVETPIAEGTLVAPFDHWLETDEAFFAARVAGASLRRDAELFWAWLVGEAG